MGVGTHILKWAWARTSQMGVGTHMGPVARAILTAASQNVTGLSCSALTGTQTMHRSEEEAAQHAKKKTVHSSAPRCVTHAQ